MGAGHMYSTVEDLLKWDQVLYTEKILSKESKEKMFTPFLNNYGYGWAITYYNLSDEDSVKAILHTGGINGFNTIFVRFVDNNQTIILFNNTGMVPLSSMAREIAKILNGFEFTYPKMPAANILIAKIEEEGVDEAVSYIKKLYEEEKDNYQFSESQINSAGYGYLRNDKIDIALEVFKLNIDLFPESFNTYDSYAEALREKGEKEKSIEYYKKSLELNPGNTNGIEMLKKLGVEYIKEDLMLDSSLLKKYEGEYQLFPNFTITIRADGSKLFARATGQSEYEIHPKNETMFYYTVVPAQIEFITNENGEVDKLILFQNNQQLPGERIN